MLALTTPHPPPPPPRSRRSARPCAARADHSGSLEKETRSDLATDHRERRGGAEAQRRRRPGRTRRPRGARLQDREAQRSCLAVSSFVSTPRCCSPPLLMATEAARASQEGCLVLTRDFTDSLRQSASENPEHEAVWTRLAAALSRPLTPPSPPPSAPLSCLLSLSLHLWAQYPLRFLPPGTKHYLPHSATLQNLRRGVYSE
ncbi:unnamed protein product [Rangifer tarandus platyrhynchus]|uniref:Uncharacterized protein n=2 Tax=Rangifer tarandus platyrhynchus TaxID=3082113 RepID=A0ABN8XWF9_RANTA|nr:unnamed protein product [Rangifer tarandus platyrhynchus]